MTTSSDKRIRLTTSIDTAVVGVEAEIKKANDGLEAVDGLRQLQFIKSKLEELKAILNRGESEAIPRSKPGIARLVVDTWPLNDPLGEQICEIEYEYMRLK